MYWGHSGKLLSHLGKRFAGWPQRATLPSCLLVQMNPFRRSTSWTDRRENLVGTIQNMWTGETQKKYQITVTGQEKGLKFSLLEIQQPASCTPFGYQYKSENSCSAQKSCWLIYMQFSYRAFSLALLSIFDSHVNTSSASRKGAGTILHLAHRFQCE